MNKDSEINKKGSLIKSLAIVGFIAIIIIISWLSVKLVNVLPSTFSSLASLAEGLAQQSFVGKDNAERQTFVVTSNTTIINTGEDINISWGKTRTQGEYTFNYSCTSGVSIKMLNIEGELVSIACDTNYNLGNNNSVVINVESEKKRFENIFYTISFFKTDDVTARATGTASFTVINSSIDEYSETEIDKDKEDESVETTEEIPVVNEPEPEPENPIVSTPSTPTYEQEFIYAIPVSDPNGRTDLSTRFLSTGNIIGNLYFEGVIRQNSKGAIQFEVKNLGTKTSDEWTYSVSLPEGNIYTSNNQSPLKPNERAVITIGFPTSSDSQFAFIVRVNEPTDTAVLNNQFSRVVNFVR